MLEQVWPEPFAEQIVRIFHRHAQTGESYQSSNARARRKDTHKLEAYDWHIERVALPDGEFGVVCYFYDLSERLRHEEHVRQLMNELNHRSKNMIGLIQAIALEPRRTRFPISSPASMSGCRRFRPTRTSSSNRKCAAPISRNWPRHSSPRSQTGRAGASRFPDRASFSTRLLRRASAWRCTKLATNATKYGALSNDRGAVDIRWRIDGDTMSCTWTERNGRPSCRRRDTASAVR